MQRNIEILNKKTKSIQDKSVRFND